MGVGLYVCGYPMMFNRLYTKILFSFLAVLVIAEILVLVSVVVGPAR